MREWRVMLGPLLIWAAHFVVVYTLASAADISSPSMSQAIRWGAVAASALCGLLLAVVFLRSRSERPSPLARQLAGIGFAVGLIAIAWQSLPLVISG
ncbi:MAG: hypothetical protein NTZ70_06715 [Methylococcales bacterium]|nr:hypothetical protein [Methylococcales bacterium]